jgi:hypothetical protein
MPAREGVFHELLPPPAGELKVLGAVALVAALMPGRAEAVNCPNFSPPTTCGSVCWEDPLYGIIYCNLGAVADIADAELTAWTISTSELWAWGTHGGGYDYCCQLTGLSLTASCTPGFVVLGSTRNDTISVYYEAGTPFPGVVDRNVFVYGLDGDDILIGTDLDTSAGPDFGILDGGGGDDLISCGYGGEYWIIGGPGDDTIDGPWTGRAWVHGDLGNDTIYTYNGNDVVCGDGGNDFINSGAGDDVVLFGSGDPFLGSTCGTGNDASDRWSDVPGCEVPISICPW